MDGCTPYHIHEESCKDDLITHVYNGTDMVVYDVNLHAYTGMKNSNIILEIFLCKINWLS